MPFGSCAQKSFDEQMENPEPRFHFFLRRCGKTPAANALVTSLCRRGDGSNFSTPGNNGELPLHIAARSGSAGLGMAIARTIVELHDGDCRAANHDDGAVVSVRIPYGDV